MNTENVYTETTAGVTIHVQPVFLDHQSEPQQNHFVWAYHVRIENNGAESFQLISRYWRITDLSGKVFEVQGDGVVGEQPVLKPGDAYEYSSGTPLDTPSGFMSGTYTMLTKAGQNFDAVIPAFSLDSPHHIAQLH
ncbi:MAG: Co2+/Mg2+ efflux protein ApaG [Rhodospirillales bacterium]|jgi:ApaG protein|nr:Co2+/Mg2+ efflux protein ApaG [Rhodospirillales bacterium]